MIADMKTPQATRRRHFLELKEQVGRLEPGSVQRIDTEAYLELMLQLRKLETACLVRVMLQLLELEMGDSSPP